jgi:broad specificity phosphatase PhoE
MLKPALRAQEIPNLQEFLITTLQHVRTLHATLSAVMTDVAAIRRTLLEEPEDLFQYKSNLLAAIETAKPLVDEALQSYDEMIRQIQDLKEWQN